MIELSVIRDLVAIFGVIAGFSYYVLTVRANQKNQELMLKSQELSRKAQEQQQETRQAQLFIQICNQTLNNPAFMKGYYVIMDNDWKDFNEYIEFRGKPGSENWNDIFLVGGILESIGVMVKEGLVDIGLIWSLMGRIVIEYYEKIGPWLVELSRIWNESRAEREGSRLEWKADYLYHELMKYVENHPEETS
jgi:hypothetical protein